eukprot:2965-Heterococcus_DN1.PRE.1
MSRTAAVYLALFLVWEFLAFWLPLKRRLLNTRGIRQPGYSSYFRQSNKDYVAPHAAGVTFAMGIAAIWPTLYSYGISILPVSRTSSLLACIGLSYE